MTKTEIIAKVTAHLLAQNERAVNADGGCAYKSSDGKMCAVGCLIAPEHYDKRFEGVSLGWAINKPENEDANLLFEALEASGIDTEDRDTVALLEHLQTIHDMVDLERWEERLEGLRRDYDR